MCTANNEGMNGTSLTEVADLAIARYGVSGSGNVTAALAYGGYQPPGSDTTATEEWTGSGA